MLLAVRRLYTFVEHVLVAAGPPEAPPLRKVAAVAIVNNPYAGRYVDDLQPLVAASEAIGVQLSGLVLDALGSFGAQSYGKGGIVGLAGEQEHVNALLTTTFARSEERRVGKECPSKCRSRWSPYH